MYASKQVAARYAVNKAIVKGELPHLSRRFDTEIKCVDCGKPAQCWDHRDYDKPLDVEPVCGSCNGKRG